MPVDFIDFSCKHNILLKDRNGSFFPMDEPRFESERIAPGTWKVLSAGDYCYILAGDGVAFAVDGGYGAGNIRKYMESVCGLPVPAILNTHDHFDHTASNAYFDRAYMSSVCAKYATVPFPSFRGIDFHPDAYERIIVSEGDVIPIPGRPLEVLYVADHAKSSLLYLDRKTRILFTGDEFFGGNFKPLSSGLTSWVAALQKVRAVLDDFDFACGGNGVMTKEHILGHIECAEYALAHPEEASVPKAGPARGPMPDYEGHPVYDRTAPHYGDHTNYAPEDKGNAKPENMRVIEHNGYRIAFDCTLIDR